MSYTLDIGVDVQEQIASLPPAALTVLAEAQQQPQLHDVADRDAARRDVVTL